jgi:hypothetical protein
LRRLFEQKKIRVVAPTAHITTAQTFLNLPEKKWQILRRFLGSPTPVGQVERSTLRVQIFLPEFVFFITERKKTHY